MIREHLQPFGDYLLLGEIARGGMGVVYQARQVSLNKRVAIKMIHSGAFASPAAVHRFRTEAEAMAQLDHPNIVPIYEVGTLEGQEYFSMKLIDGGSLAEALREGELKGAADLERQSAAAALPPTSDPEEGTPNQRPHWRVACLVAKLARAVHHAHARGVLHRDLKPSNILVDSAGEPHLTDFGIAKLVEVDARQTQTGGLLGTPHYMAPEQVTGSSREITTAADIYSLGAILFELLTGRVPFEGDVPLKVLKQVVETPPPRPRLLNPQVDPDLETVCLKCLNKEPGARYATAEELALDLERWISGEPVSARPLGAFENLRRQCSRHPLTASLVAVVALLLLTGVIGMAVSWRHIEEARRRAEAEQKQATLHASESHDRFARLCVEHANRLLDSSDGIKALPWLVEGLALEKGHPDAERFQRIRLGYAFRDYPGLRDLWFLDAGAARMDLSPDGRSLVAGDRSGTVTLWDTQTGRRLATLGHTSAVDKVLFSPDSSYFAVALGKQDSPGRLEIWNVSSNSAPRFTFDHSSAFGALRFSAGGTEIFCGLKDGSLKCLEVGTGRVFWSQKAHSDSIESLSLSPDGTQLATGSWDESVGFWDVRSGHPLGGLLRVGGYVRAVVFAPDGRHLVVACDDGIARVYDTASDHRVAHQFLHGDRIYRLQVSPDGRSVVSCGRDGSVKIWELGTGKLLSAPISNGNVIEEAFFTPDSQRVVTVSWGKNTTVWEAATGKRVGSPLLHFGSVIQARLSPDGDLLYTASADQTVRVWRTPRLTDRRGWMAQYSGKIYAASFSADGRWMVSGGADKLARIHSVAAGGAVAAVLHHSNAVESCGFSPDGRSLFTASFDGGARMWEVPDGRLSFSMRRESSFAPSSASPFAFSADSRWLATSEDPDSLQIWDLARRQPLVVQLKLPSYLLHAVFSPRNGLLALSGGTRQELQPGWSLLLEVSDSGVKEVRRERHPRIVWQSAFSPDGSLLATTCGDGIVRLWSTESGNLVHDRMRHSDVAMNVAFSPKGDLLVSAGEDQTAQVWRVPSGEPACPPIFLEGRAAASFDPSGTLLATTSREGTARLWEVRRGQAISPRILSTAWITVAGFSPEGRNVLLAGADGLLQLQSLEPNEEPLEALRWWSTVLTGMRVSPTGQAVHVPLIEVEAAWNQLRARGGSKGSTKGGR